MVPRNTRSTHNTHELLHNAPLVRVFGETPVSEPRTSDDLERYTWLLSGAGASLLQHIDELGDGGMPDLRIAEKLRQDHPADRVALAMTQRDLRQRARVKLAHADRLFFTREGLEQATSDRIANHRACRFASTPRVVDLCCGIGGDLMALAGIDSIEHIAAVDLDPVHLLLAKTNVAALSPERDLDLIQADVRDVDLTGVDGVFIDPARRSTHGRLGGITSEPPLEWATALVDHVPAVGIKTAPGIPHELIPEAWELETIALGLDLKEAVLWSPPLAHGLRSATVIDNDTVHHLTSRPGDPVSLVTPVAGEWLLDPNPAVTRAGLVEDLARETGASKIDTEIGFLVSERAVCTPFARCLRIVAALPWHEKRVRAELRALDAGPIDIRRRGLAGDVDAITKRLRGKGSRRFTVAMTRVDNSPWAIICEAG